MNDQLLFNGFTKLANDFWWIATLEHFAVLVILLLFWGNLKSKWRFVDRVISSYWALSFGLVAFLFITNPGWTFVFFGVIIAFPAVLFLVEALFPTFDYTLSGSPKKINLIVGIVLILFGIWYPAYNLGSWLEAFLQSPLGVLPSPTLMIAQGMLIIIYPKIKKSLLWSVVLLGFFFGSTSVYRFHLYWDLVLVSGSFYGLKILTDNKKRVQLDLALEP